jgi:hypothetical protein
VTIEAGKTGTFEESGKNPGSLFLSVLAMLLGFALLGFFVNGVGIVFFPSERSRSIGWI